MNDMNSSNDMNERVVEAVEPRRRQGLAIVVVAFLAWAASMVLYPVSDSGGTSNLAGLALTGLCIGPALVIIGARHAVGVRSSGWNFQPGWLTGPIVVPMLILPIGAAATDAPRNVLAVAAGALLVLLVGFISVVSRQQPIDSHSAHA